jgi:hypothetical protein
VAVQDETGTPVWGVAWLTAECNRRRLVNLINYRHESVTVHLDAKGKAITGMNLFDATPVRSPVVLRPLEPLLVEAALD